MKEEARVSLEQFRRSDGLGEVVRHVRRGLDVLELDQLGQHQLVGPEELDVDMPRTLRVRLSVLEDADRRLVVLLNDRGALRMAETLENLPGRIDRTSSRAISSLSKEDRETIFCHTERLITYADPSRISQPVRLLRPGPVPRLASAIAET